MGSTTMLTVLRIFLTVLGVLTAVWGIYDMFGEGQQSSMGLKKIIGGVAFGAISYFSLTWAIDQVNDAASQAGISACIHLFSILSAVHIPGLFM